jgi:hypothetical protein
MKRHRYSSTKNRKGKPTRKPFDWMQFLNIVLNLIRLLLDLFRNEK